jgi:nitroreductase
LVRQRRRIDTLGEAASIYLSVQNLLLGARALGLAANITMWHLLMEDEWKHALAIPASLNTFALVPVGWPAGKFGPVRRQRTGDAVHWQRWRGATL